jgi:RNA polymerase sigma-70 factor (ECF subfamily)
VATSAESAPEARFALFEGIYDSELSYVWSSLRRLGIPERDLEDVAHDVFVVVHRRLDEYDRSRPIRPWIFGIAFRVASKYRRKSSNRRELLSDPDEPTVPSTAHAHLAQREAKALVAQALEALDLDRRAVFVMHELDGITVPEIATSLDVPLNTAYSRLRLARQEFASAVRRHTLRGGAA